MTPDQVPPASVKPSGILARAQRLGTGAMLAVAACASLSAGTMTLDYSGVSKYSNSGFFTGSFDESKADGIILPGGFKLWGDDTRTDRELFWRYNQNQQQTVPGSDTTGIAFLWGGKITGTTTSYDKLTAPFEFSVDFSNYGLDPHPQVNARLTVGWGYRDNTYQEPYVPSYPGNLPTNGNFNYGNSNYVDYYNKSSGFEASGSISVGLPDTDFNDTTDLYWFTVLTVEWSSEFVSSRFAFNYDKLNDDWLTVTIPKNSIDVTYLAGSPPLPPTPTVPDSGSTIALLGLTLMGLGCLHRRR